jgi:uncharacterized protein YndB with AHSA1/START domain
MAENTVSEIEQMVVTRIFDAPRELVWKAWTDPKYIMQWWGPKGFTAPVCEMDFRVGGKLLCCMKAPDGQEFWNAVEYHEIVPYEKIVSLMYFSALSARTKSISTATTSVGLPPWGAH